MRLLEVDTIAEFEHERGAAVLRRSGMRSSARSGDVDRWHVVVIGSRGLCSWWASGVLSCIWRMRRKHSVVVSRVGEHVWRVVKIGVED